jgi:hypothetical protein
MCRGTRSLTALAPYADQREICLVALILHGFLRRSGNRPFVRILRQIAIAPNHLFPIHNANQPLALACIPGNFHSIGTHSYLPLDSKPVPDASGIYPARRSLVKEHGEDSRVARGVRLPVRLLLIPLVSSLWHRHAEGGFCPTHCCALPFTRDQPFALFS